MLEDQAQRADCDIGEACRRLGVEFGMGQYEALVQTDKLLAKLQRSLDTMTRRMMSRKVWCLAAAPCVFECISARAGPTPRRGSRPFCPRACCWAGRQVSEF